MTSDDAGTDLFDDLGRPLFDETGQPIVYRIVEASVGFVGVGHMGEAEDPVGLPPDDEGDAVKSNN